MKRWNAIVIVAATAIKLWLAGARTLEAIGWAGHDDWWFLQRAISILHGQWLGPYNHLTLIKGQGYPLWVAFISLTHIPLLFAQQLLYAVACFAVCWALGRAEARPTFVVLYVVLLFNPMTASNDTSIRVTREGLYPALALLVIAGAAGAVLRTKHALAWSTLCGVALALFWHTREEGVWLAPVLACALLIAALQRKLAVVVLPLLIVVAAHYALVVANGMNYGVYAVVEFKWTPFLRAYGSLTSVRSHPPMPRFPVPKEARERIYAVSPAFAELRPQLEGQLGIDWRRNGSNDLGGESFMWAFREAVEKVGYYQRGSAAVRDYYERVAREIEAARRDGRLDARAPHASLVPPLLYGQRAAALRTWFRGMARAIKFEELSITRGHSEGYDSELRAFAETTHERLAPRRVVLRRVHLAGQTPLDVSVTHADGTPIAGARIAREAQLARFEIDVEAPDPYLVLSQGGRPVTRVELGAQKPAGVDDYSFEITEPPLSAADAFRLDALQRIGRIYQRLVPWIFTIALLLYLPFVKRDVTTAILMAGLLGAVALRVLILSLIDVTSFDVFTAGYQAPEYPLLLIVAVVAAHKAIDGLRARLSAR